MFVILVSGRARNGVLRGARARRGVRARRERVQGLLQGARENARGHRQRRLAPHWRHRQVAAGELTLYQASYKKKLFIAV